MNPKPHSLNNPPCLLGEGPFWHKGQSQLYWTDILGKKLWRFDETSQQAQLVWKGMTVGGLAGCKDGLLLLATDTGIFKLNPGQEPQSICPVELAEGERFNDVIVDPRGRLFGGSMRDNCKDGCLFRIEAGRKPFRLLEGLGISNGMAFSSDEKFFFHTDSVPGQIMRYHYHAETGEISDGEIWFQVDQADGSPDGMTLDSNDHAWVACWGGGQILHLDSNGNIIERIPVPADQPTSVTFGGPDYRTLFITSAARGAVDPETGCDKDGKFMGGPVYQLPCQATGRPEHLATF